MTDVASHLAFLRDARLAAHATSATPAWLWNADATRILWANPVGAAIFGAATPPALAERPFDPREQAAAQIVRLAGSLRLGAAPRLERLRGFGAGFGRALTCACARIALADHVSGVGILVVATEPAGPSLALTERIRRLYDGSGVAIAGFGRDGNLIHATPEGHARLGAHTTLAALGAEHLAAAAAASGHAEGDLALGKTTLDRLGADATTVLIATFAPQPIVTPQPTAAPEPAVVPVPIAPPVVAEQPTIEPPHVEAPPTEPVPHEPTPSEPTSRVIAETFTPAPPQPPTSSMPVGDDAPAPADPANAERRHPLRFVWQMDPAGRFTLGSDEFTEVIGPGVATALGRPWDEINAELTLDPEGQVAHAVASRDTWSGITVSWPVDGSADRLKVELSGLPIFDRNRNFLGYRGFGVCRDIDRIATLAEMRRHAAQRGAPATAAVTEPAPSPEPVAAAPDAATAEPTVAPAPDVRPTLTIVPASPNVVPFRSSTPSGDAKTPALSPVERNAFHELARQLTARLKGERERDDDDAGTDTAGRLTAAPALISSDDADDHDLADRPLLDRVPVGVLVYRLDTLLYANRAFLDWTGHDSLDALAEAGGLDTLFVDGGGALNGEADDDAGRSLAIATPGGDKRPVAARLFSIAWDGDPALALMLTGVADHTATENALQRSETHAHELKSILDAATDGVVVVEPDGRIVAANRGAQALFGYSAEELLARRFAELFAPASRTTALEQLASRAGDGDNPSDPGREVIGQVRQGGTVALVLTLGRVAGEATRVCALFRDVTTAKATERDLIAARDTAEKASAAKSDFLAKVSHEIRTPLNAIIGFSEVMLEERFGPIGNERYREYLKDIRVSGEHVVALLNDLLDLSKIEAGKLDLAFANLNLNEVVQGCVTLMQPQANRERIIIRSSLSPVLRPVVADARSVRQIVLNLLSNSIKFTGAGGQVIVSTVQSAGGDVMLRVRDTGIGMDDKELSVALEPFRQLATATRWGSGGTGLGLPLTKALVEQNRARFNISSKVNDGTLVEVAFPPAAVPAE